ncbi:MAG: hypothetical protein ACK452_00480 [Bacteroidota bacterium]|jgi:hypothetical protein
MAKRFFLSLVFVLTFCVANSQSDTLLKVITTFSGKEYIGKVLQDDGREILIETQTVGKVYLQKSDVKDIKILKSKEEIINNEYGGEGPFTTRYVFTNNALPIRKGENYYMLNLFGPEFHFAVSNNMNVGIMTTWIGSPMVLALKYTFKNKESKLNFSAGTLLGTSGYIRNFKGFGGLHWLSATYGDRNNNITFSAGYGYFERGLDKILPKVGTYYNVYPESEKIKSNLIHGPLCSLSAIFKIGAKASFVFDNMALFYKTSDRVVESNTIETSQAGNIIYNTTYIVKEYSGIHAAMIFMPGFRVQKSDTKATQFSIAMVLVRSAKGEPTSFPLPMVSWFRKF